MKEKQEEYTKDLVKGDYTDTIIYKDGRIEVQEGKNLIVNGLCNLITCLLANKEGHKGLGYWAIGTGDVSWDDLDELVKPNVFDDRLHNEVYRKALRKEDFHFLTEDDEETDEITNRLGVKILLDVDEVNTTWREFGLFGGDATNELNSGIMINHKIHTRLTKEENMQIQRYIRFTFL